MTKPNIYWASDYAGMKVPRVVNFYYGYEEEDEDGDWCFTADFVDDSKNVKIPFPRLGADDASNCQDCLLHGIAQLIQSGHLK